MYNQNCDKVYKYKTPLYSPHIFILWVLANDCWMIHHFVLVTFLLWFINLDNKELIQEMISSPSWGRSTPPNAMCQHKVSGPWGHNTLVVACGTMFMLFAVLARGSAGKEALVWGAARSLLWSPLPFLAWLLCLQTIKRQNIGKAPLDISRLKRAVVTFSAHISSLQLSTTRGSFDCTLPPGDPLDWNKHLFRLGLWVLVILFVTVIKENDLGPSGNNRVEATSCPSYWMF